eukprot:TRINITY_DN4998_c0_g1_i1.p1 TRINITY_DN4998_c0_g1~~TRINITY_DN4998_c0_g1_i1.p1  ORF type:complete len:327 (-),score=108.84 TRINITY_DN4998_c0_g1_i1:1273-2253(-)
MAAMANAKSPAVKRLMREAMELSDPTSYYYAQPLEDNIFEWHFTIRGPSETDYEGGIYHGRIILPFEYPMKPPSIILLTPNGRFQTNRKICLSISGHHPETWQPAWSIRTALLAIIAFLPQGGAPTLESIELSPEERRSLAKKSSAFQCQTCGSISSLLKDEKEDDEVKLKDNEEMKEIVKNLAMKEEVKTEKEIIHEASIRTRENFRLKLASRLGGLVTTPPPPPITSSSSSTTASSSASSLSSASTSSNPSATNPAASTRRTSSASTGRRLLQAPEPGGNSLLTNIYDGIIILLVAAIAIILYRRLNAAEEDGNSGGDPGLMTS